MSNILTSSSKLVNQADRKPSPRKALAASLLRDWDSSQAVASADHDRGNHVGLNADSSDVACGACTYSGDMPRRPGMTRTQYLARNIAAAIQQMQLNADINELEFGAW